MTYIVGIFCLISLSLLSFVSIYQWAHALLAIATQKMPRFFDGARTTRFLILIPAHNEEDGLPETLQSLSALEYPKQLIHIVVIADRCSDATATAARDGGAMCLER